MKEQRIRKFAVELCIQGITGIHDTSTIWLPLEDQNNDNTSTC